MFLSAYYLCANANSPSSSQNSPSLPQNSVRLSNFSPPKQCSRNSIPPVSYLPKGSSESKCHLRVGERLTSNTIRGNRTESLREENPPLRGSPRGPAKTSERSSFVT